MDAGGNAAACVLGQLTLVGELDGQPVNVQISDTSSAFQQGSTPHTFDVDYAGGTLHLEWGALIGYSQTTAATGTAVMPAGAPHAGEAICAGSGTMEYIDPSGNNGNPPGPENDVFSLGTLSSGPTCPGIALAGTINGCVGEQI
jgi:hypothetical protein